MPRRSAITGEVVSRGSVDPDDKHTVPWYKRKRRDSEDMDSDSNALNPLTKDDVKGRKRGEPR